MKFLRQFQLGVLHLHQHGVLRRRDLKPGNIMFDELVNLKIIDFGLAREKSTDVSTWTGTAVTKWARPFSWPRKSCWERRRATGTGGPQASSLVHVR